MALTPEQGARWYPGVEFKEKPGNNHAGFLNVGQLAAHLGFNRNTLSKHLLAGLFLPDFITSKGIFFNEDRLQEIKAKWDERLTVYPGSEPVRGIITPFGMMLPRVRPKREVLERLTLTKPKRRSRDSSWRTRKRYDLQDLS